MGLAVPKSTDDQLVETMDNTRQGLAVLYPGQPSVKVFHAAQFIFYDVIVSNRKHNVKYGHVRCVRVSGNVGDDRACL